MKVRKVFSGRPVPGALFIIVLLAIVACIPLANGEETRILRVSDPLSPHTAALSR